MPKNIVILADGTGQEGGRGVALNTNVYRLFNMLEDKTPRQIVFYDPGIGTGWRKLTGNVGGAGISRNIQQAYRFIFDNYVPGDRIFLIGFSRGAATVRSLSGFIHHFGILPRSRPELIKKAYKIYKTRPPWFGGLAKRAIAKKRLTEVEALAREMYYGDLDIDSHLLRHHEECHGGRPGEPLLDHDIDESEGLDHQADHDRYMLAATMKAQFENYAKELLAASDYEPDAPDAKQRAKRYLRAVKLEKRAKEFISANHTQWTRIELLGCFDTVAALGLPYPAADAIINAFPFSRHKFHNFNLAKSVSHAYHALAIDDERIVFNPVLWTPDDDLARTAAHRCATPGCAEPNARTLEQVWFTGMHTDVGGGYTEPGLAQITLMWMLHKAHRHGLLLHPRDEDAVIQDFTDVMHDSRGRWSTRLLYRRGSRQVVWDRAVHGTPIVHESVLRRAEAAQIRMWRAGKADLGAGKDYRPWITAGESGDFEIERWPLIDKGEGVITRIGVKDLVQLQEQRWQEWMDLQRQTLPWLKPAVHAIPPSAPRPTSATA